MDNTVCSWQTRRIEASRAVTWFNVDSHDLADCTSYFTTLDRASMATLLGYTLATTNVDLCSSLQLLFAATSDNNKWRTLPWFGFCSDSHREFFLSATFQLLADSSAICLSAPRRCSDATRHIHHAKKIPIGVH